MSLAAEPRAIIGVNWGSTNLRAYLIGGDGGLLDEWSAPRGVVGLDRAAMAEMIDALAVRWPNGGPIYASGMIGSDVGWQRVPYAEAPADAVALHRQAAVVRIGAADVALVPGVACRRRDGRPDVLRGEEIELLGLAALAGGDGLAVLPGTHTKWAWLEGGRIGEFFTSMSGEMFDRLTAAGLLASITTGDAHDGAEFHGGVADGLTRDPSLGTALFGARARVMHGDLSVDGAASYLRGLLIGAEIADARALYPSLGEARVPLVGNAALCRLYAAALAAQGIASDTIDSRRACLAGFRALHEAGRG